MYHHDIKFSNHIFEVTLDQVHSAETGSQRRIGELYGCDQKLIYQSYFADNNNANCPPTAGDCNRRITTEVSHSWLGSYVTAIVTSHIVVKDNVVLSLSSIIKYSSQINDPDFVDSPNIIHNCVEAIGTAVYDDASYYAPCAHASYYYLCAKMHDYSINAVRPFLINFGNEQLIELMKISDGELTFNMYRAKFVDDELNYNESYSLRHRSESAMSASDEIYTKNIKISKIKSLPGIHSVSESNLGSIIFHYNEDGTKIVNVTPCVITANGRCAVMGDKVLILDRSQSGDVRSYSTATILRILRNGRVEVVTTDGLVLELLGNEFDLI